MTTELTIDRLGHHGDGVGGGPDGAVFVPMALPGERVAGEVEGDRMDGAKILSPSPERVRPPCPHYRQCGGCSLQHASDRFVADWKAEVISTALAAHDLAAPMRQTLTSPLRSRRRATLAGKRTKKGALVGFHARRSDVVVQITDCHVLTPALMAIVPVLEEITRLGASRSATLAFALTESATGIDLAVSGGKPLDGPLRAALPQFASHFTRLTWGDEPVFMDAAPILTFGPAMVSPPAGAFLQATAEGERALLAGVKEATHDATVIADLFAGCGTFALPLAATATVHAVEEAADLLTALDSGARHAQGLRAVTTETRDLFRRPLLPEELSRFDAVVIDPPRAGAEAQTCELAKAQVPRIAMVSCNPVTFARDAAMLVAGGYTIDWVQPVDQFRWSVHVELAAALRLAHIPA